MQLTVHTCLEAGRVSKKQRRYSKEWVVECLLLRIKGSGSYDHIRDRGLLPMPCSTTLDSKIERLDWSAGFKDTIFRCLKAIGGKMDVSERQG